VFSLLCAADITGDADAVAAACAAVVSSQLSHRLGFRTVELVRLPIAEAVKDLFPAGKKGWDVDSTFGVSKTHWWVGWLTGIAASVRQCS
jgi:hypothetical protein